jgi:hypothetical protein
MSKTLKSSNLSERPASRTLLAVCLCATMAAFGCTTDRNVSGDPVVTPGVRTSPTGGMSGGSETGNMPPPMMSSYSGEALPAVQPRRVAGVSAAEAAAILAEQQPRVRYLGPGYAGAPNRPYVSDGQTNLFTYPAQQVNPRTTVNSSITSGPTAVVTSGAGEGIGGGVDAATAEFLAASGAVLDNGTGVTGASTLGGSTITGTGTALGTNVTIAGSTATVTPSATMAQPATVSPSATTISPTVAATVVPSGFAATRSLSPTAAAVVNPPASISSLTQSSTIAGETLSPTAASVANAPASISALPATATRTATTSRRTTAAATNTATTGTATTATAPIASTNVGVSNPVRVMTDANGRVVVTNQRQR